ncbi:hypothetical protein [Halorhabdus salina]|uniref:hypothetical protein n=1 Tax=Halorhabdus salina TaxID=2750670 RepID=UPI0015EEA8B0|nr:hypothetical protein [Halorhabdus salina]
MPQSSRRQFLRAGGFTLSLGLAGCSLPLQSSSETETTGQQIGAINLDNGTDETVTASVFLLRDGNRIYWETHELDNNGSLRLTPPTYEGGTGHHLLGIRNTDTNTTEVLDVTEWAQHQSEDDNCYFIWVTLSETGIRIGRATGLDEYKNCTASDAG